MASEAIYNCHHDGDQYRITKFVDGNPESSYLCDHVACECPAGVRDTCRHRQMLPEFLARDLVNSHLFIAWDLRGRPTVDFQGRLALPDDLPKYEEPEGDGSEEQDELEPHSEAVITADFDSADTGSNPVGAAKSWRRF